MRWRLAVVAAFAALIGIGALVMGRRAPEAAAASASAPPEPPRGLAAALTFRPAVTPAPQLPSGALAAGGATFAPGGEISVPLAMRWSVEGASATAPEPADPLPGVEHFFLGNDPASWRTSVPRHESALYRQLRPGLDVKATPRGRGLTLTVTASPQALRDTWFRWDGPAQAKVEEGGRLALATPEGTLTQTLEGPVRLAQTRALPGGGLAYRLEAGIQPTGGPSGTFQVGVSWSYLLPTGFTSSLDSANDLHTAPDGTVVVVGETAAGTGFFAGALDGGTNRGTDAYVAKFSADAGLIWGAYLGGSGSDLGEDVAFDPAGNLYVVGKTQSNNYPILNWYQSSLKGAADVFVTSLAPAGNAIRWSTYLGGTSTSTVSEDALAVGVDPLGDVWLGGYTSSANFPTVNAFDTVCDNTAGYPSNDAFIAELSDAGNTLLFSSFFGAPGGGTEIYDLAFDPVSGDVIAVGDTASPSISISGPLTPPLQANFTGTLDGVILRLPAANPSQPSYFSYLGGSVAATIESIALDGTGAIYLSGVTSSPDFPHDGGLGNPPAGGRDAFVTKLFPGATSIQWSSLFGGTGDDDARNLALDPNGGIWLGGHTSSAGISSFQGSLHGSYDAFAARVSPAGDSMDWASYLGGNGNDDGRGITLDARGNVYLAGDTDSTDFPVPHSNNEGFLLKLDTTPPAGGAARDGPRLGFDDAYQSVTSAFAANWNGFSDPDSPVVRYEFAVGTAPGLVDVTGGFRDAGSLSTGVAGGLTLQDGQTYYATVRAISGAGLVSAPVSSDGVTVDTTEPPDGGVRDGPGPDRQFQRPSDPIEANWDPMVDPTSGTVLYLWAIGTDLADNDVQDFTDAGPALSASASVATVSGRRYHVTVKAVNGAGLSTRSGSNGVVVDGTAPAPGTVWDGPTSGADVDAQPRTAPIEATWSGFLDPESGIARYEYAVGTSAGGTQLLGFTSVGTATSASASGLPLVAGGQYFVTVRAYNNAGDFTPVSSDGVLALGVDGDGCTSPDQCASNLCHTNVCLAPGTAVLLAFSRDGGTPAHFGEREAISAEVTSIATDLPALKLVMTADGLALAAADAGTATCDQGETLPVDPVPADQAVTVPVYAYVCRGPGGTPPSLTGHLEDGDGGRLTPDTTLEVPVEAQRVQVGCNCASAPGALAVGALLWALGRRRRKAPSTLPPRRGATPGAMH